MILYIASHGQTINQSSLSELGEKQARLLGEHLGALSFHGKILSASAAYVQETASILAGVTGAQSVAFPFLDPIQPTESKEDIHFRAVRGYIEILASYPNEDILILAHAETCDAFIDIFKPKRKLNTRQYNCALTTLKPANYFTPVLYDTSFLPYEETTLDGKFREEYDLEYMNGDWKATVNLPDFSAMTGERILHIGDTESASYPYYRKLIEAVKPDVILHTGDMADEVKIGRHPEYLHQYTVKITELFKIMKSSGARIIVVLGNHDVEEAIRTVAPDVEVYAHGSEVILSGFPCRVGHQVKDMIYDRKYCMYGHGLDGEAWRDCLNIPGEACRFNIMFGSYVYDLQNERYVNISRPNLTR